MRKDDTPCQKSKEPLNGCCCCNCVMNIPLVHDFFHKDEKKGFVCIGVLVSGKGDDSEYRFIEESGEHGICELYMDQPLKTFFR